MSEANVELARRGFDAVARGDVEAIREFLDPDVKWHGGDESSPGACHSSDDVVEYIEQARRRGPVPELVDVIDAGERVVCVLRPHARETEQPPLRANLVTFRHGRVLEMVAFESPEDALAALAAT